MGTSFDEVAMKTVCVGRFFIDIPASSEIAFGSGRIGGWEVSPAISETGDEFAKRLAKREKELLVQKNGLGGANLEAALPLSTESAYGKVFMFERIRDYFVRDEQRVQYEVVSFESMLHSRGRSFRLFAEFGRDEALSSHARTASQFERWEFGQLPERPGFCLGDAFVAEPLSSDDNEFVMMFIGMREHPDLAIAISTWANIQLEAPLLEREKSNSVRQQYAKNFRDLGTGSRAINGIEGGQTAHEVAEHNGTIGYSFQWESLMEKNSVRRPRILLEMDTGKGRPGNPVESSLSRAEALILWQKISSSVRDRPEKVGSPEYSP